MYCIDNDYQAIEVHCEITQNTNHEVYCEITSQNTSQNISQVKK